MILTSIQLIYAQRICRTVLIMLALGGSCGEGWKQSSFVQFSPVK